MKPVDLYPSLPDHLTTAQRIALWVDLMNAADELLWAGLRREHPTEEAARAAYRAWHERRNEEKNQALMEMAQRMAARRQIQNESHDLTKNQHPS